MIGVGTTIFLVNPATFPVSSSYLLDSYSAAVAYSLRQLKTGVTNVIRVRRTGDNAENDFTAADITGSGLSDWVVAGGGTQDGHIVTWYDQSGNGNDATQSTASSQQQIVSSGSVLTDPSNGLPAATPVGTNDSYNLTTGITTTQIFAMAWVFQRVGTNWSVSLGKAGANNPMIQRWDTSDNISTALSTLTVADNNATTGDILSFILRDSSNNVKYWINNTAGTTKTHTTTGQTLDRLFLTSSVRHADPVQELIYWDTDVESSRTDIQDNINTYYSIY